MVSATSDRCVMPVARTASHLMVGFMTGFPLLVSAEVVGHTSVRAGGKSGSQRMQRPRTVLAGLLGLALLCCLATTALRTRQDRASAYTLEALRAMLAVQPARWEGRTVVVQAKAEPCPWWDSRGRHRYCADRTLVLVDTMAGGDPLPLDRPAHSWIPQLWYRLPVLGRLLPWPPKITIYAIARFRVQLQPLTAVSCWPRHCFVAQVLGVLPTVTR
jgi:hypothetical protein